MKDFICAYFGKDWTITARGFGSAKQAEKHGLYMMPMAGCFGFVVVEETEESWTVNDNMSIHPPVWSITRTDLNNYTITV